MREGNCGSKQTETGTTKTSEKFVTSLRICYFYRMFIFKPGQQKRGKMLKDRELSSASNRLD